MNLCFVAEIEQVHQNHKRVRVIRLETTNNNQRIVGLFIPNAAVESVLTGLFFIFQNSGCVVQWGQSLTITVKFESKVTRLQKLFPSPHFGTR